METPGQLSIQVSFKHFILQLQVRNFLDQAKVGGRKLCVSNSRVEALLNNKVCSVHTETCGTILGILVKAVKNDKYSPYLIEK